MLKYIVCIGSLRIFRVPRSAGAHLSGRKDTQRHGKAKQHKKTRRKVWLHDIDNERINLFWQNIPRCCRPCLGTNTKTRTDEGNCTNRQTNLEESINPNEESWWQKCKDIKVFILLGFFLKTLYLVALFTNFLFSSLVFQSAQSVLFLQNLLRTFLHRHVGVRLEGWDRVGSPHFDALQPTGRRTSHRCGGVVIGRLLQLCWGCGLAESLPSSSTLAFVFLGKQFRAATTHGLGNEGWPLKCIA
mmetsp:Transcript_21884/g.36142  ORF Transcript_21884/g.36142 Transcript_21884/m.36142 type:complete len:244 (-) Transcript_21884:113-844(-)